MSHMAPRRMPVQLVCNSPYGAPEAADVSAAVVYGSARFVSDISSPFTSGDNMAGGANKKLTREEELLLQDFSRNVSTKSSALFYGNAFIVSAIPMCK